MIARAAIASSSLLLPHDISKAQMSEGVIEAVAIALPNAGIASSALCMRSIDDVAASTQNRSRDGRGMAPYRLISIAATGAAGAHKPNPTSTKVVAQTSDRSTTPHHERVYNQKRFVDRDHRAAAGGCNMAR
jgi:hypothetical protein